jgi:hypothetical protein
MTRIQAGVGFCSLKYTAQTTVALEGPRDPRRVEWTIWTNDPMGVEPRRELRRVYATWEEMWCQLDELKETGT